jgi:hypothetical protein
MEQLSIKGSKANNMVLLLIVIRHTYYDLFMPSILLLHVSVIAL